ncbi:MAG: protoheme IX farnesyltransferase [Paucibacter sp.]|nr:protoheme IX farnesyltransferase [Roseateles sp.]
MAVVELAKPLPVVRACWREYLVLTKPRVVALMAFTVAVGMLLSSRTLPPWRPMLFGLLGIALVAGAAAAINHLVDFRLDAVMARTRARPLPRGVLRRGEVLGFSAVLGVSGMALLLVFTNLMCALLTLASLLGYAVVYSLYLKYATPQNIVIGGAAGAAPPLLGWVAITGQVDGGALALFLIIFVWTPPHFWALAIHRRDDYAKADVPMLPVTHGVPFTAHRVLVYAVALLPVSLIPVAIDMSGWVYFTGASLLGLRFIGHAWRLKRDPQWSMPTFRFSIAYLFGLFAALLADHYLMG